MKIYIAGPMSGMPDFNFPAFHAEAANLRALGYEVVNPAEINDATDGDWSDYMREDIKQMMDCGGIFMLPGWENSRGASLEWKIAVALGFDIMGVE